ncbi:TIGR03546 family protein [Catenovulum sp. SM1970]|uniref:TIGR03546 family protein n=1 Tax=Marinifaba aquimaris TaxID=2741323 RepID=UPI001572560C|nr:TIGR03546 family protein [Marinifaba aquimaris]NTS78789.1 TIGR03546 family protein [Marinifaba aquimaris]
MLTLIAKLLHALNSEDSPRQVAFGIALGMIIGLTPTFTLHNLIILLFACIIRVHLGSVILAFTFFAGLSYLTDPLSSHIGESLLTSAGLQTLWHSLYQSEIFKLAQLHHTLTLGSLLISIILCTPVALFSQWLIARYRIHIKQFIERFKIVQTLKASKFYGIYQKVAGTV